MGKIKIAYESPGGDSFVGDLDNKEVTFTGSAKAGNADLQVKAGEHKFVFFLEGSPGATYTVKLDGADPAKDPVSDAIAANGKAAGFFIFSVPKAKAKSNADKAAAVAAAGSVAVAGEVGHKVQRRRSKTPSKSRGDK